MADTQDDSIEQSMDDAFTAGGKEAMYKDLTRKARNFRDNPGEGDVEDMLKAYRRDQAHKRRVSLRQASDRATGRSSGR